MVTRKKQNKLKNSIKSKEAIIVYQIYPLSFYDSNNDGFGDIKGIISKLDYILWMGFTHLWICSIYKTQFRDNGYDVTDYKQIDNKFGTMKDFNKLIKEAKKRNISIIMDIVMNHTSNKNTWFLKSIDKNKYKNFYIWRDKPNALISQFENNSWTFISKRNQYYFHHFSKYQPDINWDYDKVYIEFAKIINFWIQKGVKGFRFDVIDMIGKDIDNKKIINITRAFKKIRKIGQMSWLKKDIFTVGECWSTSTNDAIKYVNKEDGVFTTLFNGNHLFIGWEKSRWDAKPLTKPQKEQLLNSFIDKQIAYHNKVNQAIFIENHDFPRAISRWFIGKKDIQAKAKVIAVSFYGMQGIPFIFQGQEAGFSNPKFKNIKDFNDLETIKFLKNNKNLDNKILFKKASFGSRDNARSQIKWDKIIDKTWNHNANFGNKTKSIKDLKADKNSILYLYKFLINIRKTRVNLFHYGKIQRKKYESKDIFAYEIKYKNKCIIYLANWGDKNVKINLNKYNKLYGEYKNNTISSLGVYIGEYNIN